MGGVGNTLANIFHPGLEQEGQAAREARDARAAQEAKMAQIRDQQVKAAKQFRMDLPNYQKQLTGEAVRSIGSQLGEAQGQARSNYSSRGLLYSGLRQAGEQQLAGQAQAGLASRQTAINKALEAEAQRMEDAANKAGAQMYEMQSANEDALYQNALQSARNASAAQGALFGAVGTGAGLLLGSRGSGNSNAQDNTSGRYYREYEG